MAFCVISENPKGSAEVYEQVMQRVVQNGELPPPGAIFQVAGPAEPGWRVISVWDSREAFESFFAERLRPAFEEVGGISPDDVNMSIFEAHSFMAGDLSGAAQPG
jgi:heme-degrading monooxygenase HmoA